jgi:hypothetical protein
VLCQKEKNKMPLTHRNLASTGSAKNRENNHATHVLAGTA